MKLTKLLKKRIVFGRNFSNIFDFNKTEFARKLFAIFVILMFMGSGVSLEVVAASGSGGNGIISDEEANAQNQEKGFEERELKDEDYNNAAAYEGTPPKIFTNPNFVVTKVPIDKIEQNIDAIIGTGKHNSLTQDQVRAISDPGKVSTLLQTIDPANIQRFSPEQIGSLSSEQLTALKPEQKAALTTEQLSNGNVLVNVGNLRDLNAANLQAAMRAKYGLAEGALFVISSGAGEVTITADGKIQNGPGSTIDIETIKGTDVLSVVISKPQDADSGFKICRTSTEPGKGCNFVKLSPETGEQMQYTFDQETGKPYMEITKPDNTKSRIELNGEVHIFGKDGVTIIQVGEGSAISVLHGKDSYTISGHNNNVVVNLNTAERLLSVTSKSPPSGPYFTIKSESLDGTVHGAELFLKNDERGELIDVAAKRPLVPDGFIGPQPSASADLKIKIDRAAPPIIKDAHYRLNGLGNLKFERDNDGELLAVKYDKNKYTFTRDGKEVTEYDHADISVVQIVEGKPVEKALANHQADIYFSTSSKLRSGKGASVQDILTIQAGELGVINKINAITDDTLPKDKIVTLKVIKLRENGETEVKDEVISCGTRTSSACREYLTAEFNKNSLQNRIVLNQLSERESGGRSYVTLTSDDSGVLHTGAVASTSGGKDGNTLTVDRDGSKSKLEFGKSAAVYIVPFDAKNPDRNAKYVSAIPPTIDATTSIDNLYENNKDFYDKPTDLVKETRTLPLQKTLADGTLLEVKVGPYNKFYALNTRTRVYKEYNVESGEVIGNIVMGDDEILDNLRDIEITEVTTSHKGAIASKVASQDIDIFKRFVDSEHVDKFKGGLAFADKSSYRSFLNNDAIILGKNSEKLAEIKTPDGRIPNVFELNKDTKKLVAAGFARVLTDFDTGETTATGRASNVAATLDTGILQLAKEDIEKTRAIIGYSEQVIRGYKLDVTSIDDLAEKVVGLYITKAQKDTAKADQVDVTQLKTQVEINVRNELEKNLGEKGRAIAHTLDAARLSYEAGLAYTKDAADKKRVEAVNEIKQFIKGTGDKFAVQQGIGLIKEEFKLTGNHDETRKLIQGIILGNDGSIRELGFNLNSLSFSERQELGLELEKLEAATYSDESNYDQNIASLKKLTEKYHQNLDDDIGRVMLQRIDSFKQGFNLLSDAELAKLDETERAEYNKKKDSYVAYLQAANPELAGKNADEILKLPPGQLNAALTAANTKSRTDTNEYLKDAISKQFLTPEQRAALLGTLAASLASEGDLGKIEDIFGNGANANIKASLALLNDKQKDQVKASFAKTLAANVDEKKLAALRQSDEFKGLPADIQAQLVYAAYERLFNSVASNDEKVRLANLAIAAGKEKGVAVSPEVYKTLSRIYASQGKLLESDLANREAAAALQQKAATQNYDSRKGFNFGTFVHGLDELARDNIEVQYAQKRYGAVIASGTFVVGATNLDRSVGDALDNKVRGMVAASHAKLGKFKESSKENSVIIKNIKEAELEKASMPELAALKQQLLGAIESKSANAQAENTEDSLRNGKRDLALEMVELTKEDSKLRKLFGEGEQGAAELKNSLIQLNQRLHGINLELAEKILQDRNRVGEAEELYNEILVGEATDEQKAHAMLGKTNVFNARGQLDAAREQLKLITEGKFTEEFKEAAKKQLVKIDLFEAQSLLGAKEVTQEQIDKAKELLKKVAADPSATPQEKASAEKQVRDIDALELFEKANQLVSEGNAADAAKMYEQIAGQDISENIIKAAQTNLQAIMPAAEKQEEELAKKTQARDRLISYGERAAALEAEIAAVPAGDISRKEDLHRQLAALRASATQGLSEVFSSAQLLDQDKALQTEIEKTIRDIQRLGGEGRSLEGEAKAENLRQVEELARKANKLAEIKRDLELSIRQRENLEVAAQAASGNIEEAKTIYDKALERASGDPARTADIRQQYVAGLGQLDSSKGSVKEAVNNLKEIKKPMDARKNQLNDIIFSETATSEQRRIARDELKLLNNQINLIQGNIDLVVRNGEVSYNYEEKIPDSNRIDLKDFNQDDYSKAQELMAFPGLTNAEEVDRKNELRKILQTTKNIHTLNLIALHLMETQDYEGGHQGAALQDLTYALRKLRESEVPEDKILLTFKGKEKDKDFVTAGLTALALRENEGQIKLEDGTEIVNTKDAYARLQQEAKKLGIKDTGTLDIVRSKLDKEGKIYFNAVANEDTNRQVENFKQDAGYLSSYAGAQDAFMRSKEAVARGEPIALGGQVLNVVIQGGTGPIGTAEKLIRGPLSDWSKVFNRLFGTNVIENSDEVQQRKTLAAQERNAVESHAIGRLYGVNAAAAREVMVAISDYNPALDTDGDGEITGSEGYGKTLDAQFETTAKSINKGLKEIYGEGYDPKIHGFSATELKNLAAANQKTRGELAVTMALRAAESPKENLYADLIAARNKIRTEQGDQLRANMASMGTTPEDYGDDSFWAALKSGTFTKIGELKNTIQKKDDQAFQWNQKRDSEVIGLNTLITVLNPNTAGQDVTISEVNRLANSDKPEDIDRLTVLLGRDPKDSNQRVGAYTLQKLRQALDDNPQVLQKRSSELRQQGKVEEANELLAMSYSKEAEIAKQSLQLDQAAEFATLAAQTHSSQQAFADELNAEARFERAISGYISAGKTVGDIAAGAAGIGALGKGVAALGRTVPGQLLLKAPGLKQLTRVYQTSQIPKITLQAEKQVVTNINRGATIAEQAELAAARIELNAAKTIGNYERVQAAASKINNVGTQIADRTSLIQNQFLRTQLRGVGEAIKPVVEMAYNPKEIIEEGFEEQSTVFEALQTYGGAATSVLGQRRSNINVATNTRQYRAEAKQEYNNYVKQNAERLSGQQAVYRGQTYNVQVDAGLGEITLVKADEALAGFEAPAAPPQIKIDDLDQAQTVTFVETSESQVKVAPVNRELGLLQIKIAERTSNEKFEQAKPGSTKTERSILDEQQRLIEADRDIKIAQRDAEFAAFGLDLARRNNQDTADLETQFAATQDTVNDKAAAFHEEVIFNARLNVESTESKINELAQKFFQAEPESSRAAELEQQLTVLHLVRQEDAVKLRHEESNLLNVKIRQKHNRITENQAKLAKTTDPAETAGFQQDIREDFLDIATLETRLAEAQIRLSEESALREETFQHLLDNEKAQATSGLAELNIFGKRQRLAAIDAQAEVSRLQQAESELRISEAETDKQAAELAGLIAIGAVTDPDIINTVNNKREVDRGLGRTEHNLEVLTDQFVRLEKADKESDVGAALLQEINTLEARKQELQNEKQNVIENLRENAPAVIEAARAAPAEAKAIAEEAAKKAAAEVEAATRKATQEADLVSEQIKDMGLTVDRITAVHAALKAEGVARLEELAGFSADKIKVLVPSLTDAEANIIAEQIKQLKTFKEENIPEGLGSEVEVYITAGKQADKAIATETAIDDAMSQSHSFTVDLSETNPEVKNGCSDCSLLMRNVDKLLQEAKHIRTTARSSRDYEAAQKKIQEATKLLHDGMNQLINYVASESIDIATALNVIKAIDLARVDKLIQSVDRYTYKGKAELKQSLQTLRNNAAEWNAQIEAPAAAQVEQVKNRIKENRGYKAQVGQAKSEIVKESVADIKGTSSERFANHFKTSEAKTAAAKLLAQVQNIARASQGKTLTQAQAAEIQSKFRDILSTVSEAEAQVILDEVIKFTDNNDVMSVLGIPADLQRGAVATLLDISARELPKLDVAYAAESYLPRTSVSEETSGALAGRLVTRFSAGNVDVALSQKDDGTCCRITQVNGQPLSPEQRDAIKLNKIALKKIEEARKVFESSIAEIELRQKAEREKVALDKEELGHIFAGKNFDELTTEQIRAELTRRHASELDAIAGSEAAFYQQIVEQVYEEHKTNIDRLLEQKKLVGDKITRDRLVQDTEVYKVAVAKKLIELNALQTAGVQAKAEQSTGKATKEKISEESIPAGIAERIKPRARAAANTISSLTPQQQSVVNNKVVSKVNANQLLTYLQQRIDSRLEGKSPTQEQINAIIRNEVNNLPLSVSQKNALSQRLIEKPELVLAKCGSPCSLAARQQIVEEIRSVIDASQIDMAADAVEQLSRKNNIAVENARRILYNIRDNKVSATQIHSQIALANNLISEIDTKDASDLRQAAQDILLQEILKAAEQAKKLAEEQNKKQEEQARQLEAAKIAAELAKARAAVQQADARAKLIDEIHSAFAVIDKNRIIGNSDKFTKKFNVINDKIKQAENALDTATAAFLKDSRVALSHGMSVKLDERLKANQNLNIALEKSRALTTVIKEMSKKARDDIVQAKRKADDVLNTKLI